MIAPRSTAPAPAPLPPSSSDAPAASEPPGGSAPADDAVVALETARAQPAAALPIASPLAPAVSAAAAALAGTAGAHRPVAPAPAVVGAVAASAVAPLVVATLASAAAPVAGAQAFPANLAGHTTPASAAPAALGSHHGAPRPGHDPRGGSALAHRPASAASELPGAPPSPPPPFLDPAAPTTKPAAAEPTTNVLAAHLLSPSAGLASDALPVLFELPPPPPGAGALWAQAAEDPSLRASIQSDGARVSLDAGAAGEMTLHLRVKDGVADVRIDGAGVPSLDLRPQELRTALAGEGLTLGGFEAGRQGRDQGGGFDHPSQDLRDPRDGAPPPAPSPALAPSPPATSARANQPAVTLGGRLHVTA